MSEDELENDLILLLQKYEHHRENAVLWETLSSETKKQIKGIVGFKIHIQEIQAAYKLSQNRNDEDYNNIINKLNEEHDLNSQQMAEVMKNRKSK
jgi:transcriptional regulator